MAPKLLTAISLIVFPFLIDLAGGQDTSDDEANWVIDFERFANPETRIAALKEWEGRENSETRKLPLNVFERSFSQVIFAKAPQPSEPDAHLILRTIDYRGYEPERYTESNRSKLTSKLWQLGEPWYDAVMVEVMNHKRILENWEEFIGVGVIADFNGDGFVDIFSIQRLHFSKNKKSKDSAYADLISIRPLDPKEKAFGLWITNVRQKRSSPREWRFDVRKAESDGDRGLGFVVSQSLVPKKELIFFWNKKESRYVLTKGNLPDSVFAANDRNETRRQLINRCGDEALSIDNPRYAIGSDDPSDLQSSILGYVKNKKSDPTEVTLRLPENIRDLTPSEAALKTVEANRDDHHRALYDLRLEGKSLKPEKGWVDVNIQPGWSAPRRSVWWLPKEGKAQVWEFSKTGVSRSMMTVVERPVVEWWMEWLLELDQVRTVPRYTRVPDEDNDRDGGNDHTFVDIQVAATAPKLRAAKYEAVPTLWNAMRGPYHRDAASVLAVALGTGPPGWKMEEKFEEKKMDEVSRVWLQPEFVKKVPPPLARHAIISIGKAGWMTHRELLEKLLKHLGEPTEAEKEITKLSKAIEKSRLEKKTAWWFYYGQDEESLRFQEMDRRLRLLQKEATGQPGFELRDSIRVAFRMLDSYNDRKALEKWSKEYRNEWSGWAEQRLKSFPFSAF